MLLLNNLCYHRFDGVTGSHPNAKPSLPVCQDTNDQCYDGYACRQYSPFRAARRVLEVSYPSINVVKFTLKPSKCCPNLAKSLGKFRIATSLGGLQLGVNLGACRSVGHDIYPIIAHRG